MCILNHTLDNEFCNQKNLLNHYRVISLDMRQFTEVGFFFRNLGNGIIFAKTKSQLVHFLLLNLILASYQIFRAF